jgi:hypothetical protein
MDTVVVLTKRSEEEMLRIGGSGNWVANEERIKTCSYLIATWNGEEHEKPHGKAFLIGRGLSVVPSSEEGRVIIRFQEFARLDHGAWPGQRNPVAYMDLHEMNIDPSTLQWLPVRAESSEAASEIRPSKLGFKLISPENIFEPDPIMSAIVVMDMRTGECRPITPHDYISRITAIAPSEKTPMEVQRAFFLTRNAMCYGYWYYPMFTLGTEQILRVADFATAEAAKQYNISPPKALKRMSFAERIEALVSAGAIPQEQKSLWDGLREFRNHVTHPSSQSIFAPSDAMSILSEVKTAIDGITWKTETTSSKGAGA